LTCSELAILDLEVHFEIVDGGSVSGYITSRIEELLLQPGLRTIRREKEELQIAGVCPH
jgi:hypothetical protein